MGRFRILSEHARGGMGELWRAHDDTLDRPVALKLLRPERMQDSEALVRFRREAVTVARLKHEHIAALYEFADDSQQPYLVMEWVEGQSLEERLRGGRLTWAAALEIFEQLMEALDYAHGQGVVHRDIKPANLMLSGQRLTVVDFGLACLLAEPSLTETGPIFGTPLYMSPEMASGGAVDGRADLYSAALVLFEMLAGKPVFGSGSVIQIISQQVHAARPILSECAPGLPVALDEVLVKALDVDPGRRYATGAEFLGALRAASNLPLARGRPFKWAGALGLVALTLGIGLAWPKTPTPPLVSATPRATPSPVVVAPAALQKVWALAAPYAPVVAMGERVLVSAPGELRALEVGDGRVAWKAPQPAAPRLLVAGEGTVLRLNGGGSLEALKVANGQQLWKLPLTGSFWGGALSSDEELYLVGQQRLQAFDPASVQEDWQIAVGETLLGVPPVANEKLVMLAAKGHKVIAYRYADSARVWQASLKATPTCLWLDEQALLVGAQDGNLMAYALGDGHLLWEESANYAEPAVALTGDDEWAVCAWKDGELACFDYEGYEAWKHQL